MSDLSEKVLLIVPCYNEEDRLDYIQFESMDSNCYFLFVNDGSRDNTLEILKTYQKDNMYLLNLEKNVGKAEAIRQGMLYTKTLPIFGELRWVGYWDADLASPLSELNYFILYSKLFDVEIDGILGSRVYKLGSSIKRSYKRHVLGRLFATLADITLDIGSYDSQCGSKIFKKELIDIVFTEPFISKWIFDVEILLRLKEFMIIEYPLRNWTDVDGSKIKILRVVIRTILEIFKIRKKHTDFSAKSKSYVKDPYT